ncbi:MAG: FAD:protein FMN transferase [bacterium]
MKKIIITVIVVVIMLSGFTVFKRFMEPPLQVRTRFIMDTLCSIKVIGGKEVIPIIDKSFDAMEAVEAKFTIHKVGAPLYEFNKTGKQVSDPEILNLVRLALDVSKKTNGALDITIVPVMRAWGFYKGMTNRVPTEAEIKDAVSKTGYKYIAIEKRKLIKKKSYIQIDLGSMAKGYAVQKAADLLRANGIKSALIDGGGNIYVIGTVAGKPWKVGIKNPRGEGVIGIVDAEDMAITTAGDYERFFVKDGINYHHIMNPKNGSPARGVASVTVMCESSTTADAWDTALFVMGKDAALKKADEVKDIEILVVTDDGKKYTSTKMTKDMVKNGK